MTFSFDISISTFYLHLIKSSELQNLFHISVSILPLPALTILKAKIKVEGKKNRTNRKKQKQKKEKIMKLMSKISKVEKPETPEQFKTMMEKDQETL